jgi:hypothetical protein
MGFFTGRNGRLVVNGREMAKVRDWSLDTTVNLLNTSTLGSYADTFVPGIKGATGSATLMYYKLEPGESATFDQFTTLLHKVQKTGPIQTTDRVRLQLNVGGVVSGSGTDDVVCDVWISNAGVAVTTGELTTVSIQFTVDGDFVEVISV